MESGIIQLFPAFSGSAETTKEEMEAYVKEAAGRFCGVTGLAIIENATVHHAHGAVYVLGEPGEEQGIVAVGNYDNASLYYKTVFISRVGVDNDIYVTYTSATSGGNTFGSMFNLQQINGWSVYMKYAMDADTVLFGLTNGPSASLNYECSYCITAFEHGGMEKKMFMLCYNNAFYASYSSFLQNEVQSAALFAISNAYAPLVPSDKEAMAEIYAAGVGLPYLKLFTNKKNMAAWKAITINGEKYAVMVKAAWTVLARMKDNGTGGA